MLDMVDNMQTLICITLDLHTERAFCFELKGDILARLMTSYLVFFLAVIPSVMKRNSKLVK